MLQEVTENSLPFLPPLGPPLRGIEGKKAKMGIRRSDFGPAWGPPLTGGVTLGKYSTPVRVSAHSLRQGFNVKVLLRDHGQVQMLKTRIQRGSR